MAVLQKVCTTCISILFSELFSPFRCLVVSCRVDDARTSSSITTPAYKKRNNRHFSMKNYCRLFGENCIEVISRNMEITNRHKKKTVSDWIKSTLDLPIVSSFFLYFIKHGAESDARKMFNTTNDCKQCMTQRKVTNYVTSPMWKNLAEDSLR